MSCSKCGSPCNNCNPCQDTCEKACCKNPCLQWGFDDCFLRARCADGTELNPLNLCEWLDEHETCTSFRLVPNGEGGSYMEYLNECDESQKIYVCDFLSLGELNCLGDVKIISDREDGKANPCDILVMDPGCDDPCSPTRGKWTNYHIPSAGDCVMQPDADGYYKVLTMNECGCIEECKMKMMPDHVSMFLRDSVPDDPDFPWYYGIYNERINLYLAQNAPEYFGQVPLFVTVNYGIQVTRPSKGCNVNFRSLVAPLIEGQTSDAEIRTAVSQYGSILQSDASSIHADNLNPGSDGAANVWKRGIPWGTVSMRGSLSFIVPTGKEAYLHHELRFLSVDSINRTDAQGRVYYHTTQWDGQRVPQNIAEQLNKMETNASRLNALQIMVRPIFGNYRTDPVVDSAPAQQLAAHDYYESATIHPPQS